MSGSRRIVVLAAVLSAAVFAVSLAALAGRIRQFNAAAGRTMYAFKEVHDRGFSFAGREVSLTDEEKEGQTVVVVKYGEQELRLLASVAPGPAPLPGLARHSDWLRVLRFAPYKGASREEFHQHLDEGSDRLAIVTRRPQVGP